MSWLCGASVGWFWCLFPAAAAFPGAKQYLFAVSGEEQCTVSWEETDFIFFLRLFHS